MTSEATKALQHETEFLSGAEANLDAAKGKALRGSKWHTVRHDEGDRLRALLAENRNYDREKLRSLPANRRVELHGFERRLLFGKRRTGVAIASVLSPLSHYASRSDEKAPPIGFAELLAHVRKLVGNARVPQMIGVCSPSGFADEVYDARLDLENVTVVLIEPDGHGGWRTTGASDDVDPRMVKLFDPEGVKQKVDRVRRLIEERSADLLTGGLSVASIASEAHLPESVVRQGFERVAADDPELKLTKKDGTHLLFRGAPVQREEKKSMNVIDRIKQLFAGDGGEAEKINLLAERRASLAQRRDRIYSDIGQLEKKEAKLFAEGKAASSSVPRRRLAAQLAQLRKDIARQNTTAAMLNKQIDIISTDIHNLTLIQQGEMAKLPDTDELTDHAVQAEEMLETLKADSDLVESLETGLEEVLASEEELAILREFEGDQGDQVDAPPVSAPTAQAKTKSEVEPAMDELPTSEPGSQVGEPDADGRRADAEPT